MYVLDKAVALLPKRLRPYAKAVCPSVATALATGAHWAVTGDFDATEIQVAVEGAAVSLIAFLFPNRSAV